MATIRAKLNKHQREFMDDTTSKFLLLNSGFGGGKSFGLCMKGFQLSKLNRGIAGGLVVPSFPEFKRDMLPLFEEILETNRIKYRYHKTEAWFRFPWSKGKLWVATAERKIRGPNWGFMLANEIGLIEHERAKEGFGRVRVKRAPNPQIALVGTPEGTSSWVYEQFVETPMPRSRVIYGDTRDNVENLGEDYITMLESSYDPIMLDAYLRGLWVNMKGNRFYYAYDPKKNDNPKLEWIEDLPVAVTLDYNVAPMVATLWHVRPLQNSRGIPLLFPDGSPIRKAQAFDQIVIDDGADIHRMDRAMREYGLDPELTTIYPDPAGNSRTTATENAKGNNTQLREKGWRIRTRGAAPRFRQRQLAANNMLAKGLIELNPVKCKALKKDCEGVEQDKATFEKIKDNPKLTHASDGMDYFLDLEFPLSGQKPDHRSTKIR